MAFHRFLKAIAENNPIPVFGDGQQTRDFTYIDDIIQANISSMINGKSGEIYNIGGGNCIKLADLFPVFEKISQKNVNIQWLDFQKGDVPHTAASIQKAQKDLFYSPKTSLEDGLSEEWKWLKTIYSF
jgi:UDP-glucose 4-epimerase